MGYVTKFVNNSALYSVSVIASKAGHYFILPLIWQYFTLEQFGILGLCQVFAAITVPFFDLGNSTAIQKFYYEWENKSRKLFVGGTIFATYIFATILCIILFQYGQVPANLVASKVPFDLIQITILAYFFVTLSQLPIAVLRIREQLRQYVAYSLFHLVLQIGLVAYFVVWVEPSVHSYLKGLLVSNFVFFVSLLPIVFINSSIPTSIKHFTYTLNFSLPLLPTGIFENLSDSVGRIVLDKFVPISQIGLFNLARQFGGLVNLGSSILKSSFVPQIFKINSLDLEADSAKKMSVLSFVYFVAISVFASGLGLFITELIGLMGKNENIVVVKYIPYFIFVFLIRAIGTAFGRGYDLRNKTYYSMIVSLITLGCISVFSYILIPLYEIWGAIIALLVTEVVKNVVHVSIAFKHFKRPVFWRSNFIILFATAICIALGALAPVGIEAILGKLVIFLIYLLVVKRISFAELYK